MTSELYKITEATNNTYDWKILKKSTNDILESNHKSCLHYNRQAFINAYTSERLALGTAISYAHNKGMFSKKFEIYEKLLRKAEERKDTIKKIMEEEYAKRETESKKYLEELRAKEGEEVAIITMTSRVEPFSPYYINKRVLGGTIEDSKKDGEKLNADKEESMKNDKK